MDRNRRSLGLALVLLGSTLFIVNAGVSRVALRAGVEPALLTTIRVSGSFAGLLVLALLFHRRALRPPTGRLRLLILVHGLVGVALLQWSYFVAIDRLPVGMALLLEYQAPLLVALWARTVQHERVRRRLWLGLGLALGGLAAATGVFDGQVAFDTVGVLAGFAAAGSFATYFLVGEAGVASMDPLRVALWSFGVGTVALNLTAPVTSLAAGLAGTHVSLLGTLAGLSAPVWLLLVWVVVLGTLVPFGVELAALRHLPATTVTMIAMLEPVGVNALGWGWFDERLGPVALAGGVAVVTGIVLAQSARRTTVLVEPPHLG